MSNLDERLRQVQERTATAARRAGRDPAAVTLVAVSKRKPAADILAAARLGQLDFGENYVQELRTKQEDPALRELPLRWHYIGPLQRNKVRHIVGNAALLHAIDSVSLLDEIEKRSAQAGLQSACLLQVNLSGEATKSGCAPADCQALARHALALPHVALRGLMTMPAPCDDPEESRPVFVALRALRDQLAERLATTQLTELSMGMSDDFEVAVEEGATLVRVGSLIFGARI